MSIQATEPEPMQPLQRVCRLAVSRSVLIALMDSASIRETGQALIQPFRHVKIQVVEQAPAVWLRWSSMKVMETSIT